MWLKMEDVLYWATLNLSDKANHCLASFWEDQINSVSMFYKELFSTAELNWKDLWINNLELWRILLYIFKYTMLPRSIAPRFIANLTYRQNSRLSRFPPLKIPCYTAKLSYRHPPQVFRHKSRKTNLNSSVSTAHNYLYRTRSLIS